MDDFDVGGLAEGIGDIAEGVVGIGATKRNGDPNWGCLFVILALAIVALIMFLNCNEKDEPGIRSVKETNEHAHPTVDNRGPNEAVPFDW